VPNGGRGVYLDSAATGTTIGGTVAGALNLISGNKGDGVAIRGNNNLVAGDYIGTDVSGTAALGNADDGVYIGGDGNTIGGTIAAAKNVISANGTSGTGYGVDISTLAANTTLGYDDIGFKLDGVNPLPNKSGGVNGTYTDAGHNTIQS
jgi:hypothetical protein